MRILGMSLAVCVAAALVGCGEPQKSARGFHLPDGDPEQGQATFVELKCNSCHTVAGVELPAPVAEVEHPLGGRTQYVRTDGALVTAIIAPSHTLAASFRPHRVASTRLSPMGDFSEAMTVHELIDVVAFLQEHYEVVAPDLSAR
jgi:hypothetical protein